MEATQTYCYHYPVTYLLHFYKPISDRHTAHHYLGCTENLRERLTDHRNGQAARLAKLQRKGVYRSFWPVCGLAVAAPKRGLNAERTARSFAPSATLPMMTLILIWLIYLHLSFEVFRPQRKDYSMITELHSFPTPEAYTGALLCPTDAVRLAHRLKDATIQRISVELEQQRLEAPVNVMISASELWLLEVFGMTLDFESGFVLLNGVTL